MYNYVYGLELSPRKHPKKLHLSFWGHSLGDISLVRKSWIVNGYSHIVSFYTADYTGISEETHYFFLKFKVSKSCCAQTLRLI